MTFFTGYIAQRVGSAMGFVENTTAGYARAQVTFTDLRNGNAAIARQSG